MRIPRELLPEIRTRHTRGHSDQAIVDWLKTQGIKVSRIAVLRARGRAASALADDAPPAPAPAAPASPLVDGKPSGAQNRKTQETKRWQEGLDQVERGPTVFSVEAEDDPKRAHLYELQVLLQLQDKVNKDPFMTLPDKARQTTAIAQAMGRIRAEAEWQKRIEELETRLADVTEDLDKERTEVEREARRLEALRRELESERKKLDEERRKLKPS